MPICKKFPDNHGFTDGPCRYGCDDPAHAAHAAGGAGVAIGGSAKAPGPQNSTAPQIQPRLPCACWFRTTKRNENGDVDCGWCGKVKPVGPALAAAAEKAAAEWPKAGSSEEVNVRARGCIPTFDVPSPGNAPCAHWVACGTLWPDGKLANDKPISVKQLPPMTWMSLSPRTSPEWRLFRDGIAKGWIRSEPKWEAPPSNSYTIREGPGTYFSAEEIADAQEASKALREELLFHRLARDASGGFDVPAYCAIPPPPRDYIMPKETADKMRASAWTRTDLAQPYHQAEIHLHVQPAPPANPELSEYDRQLAQKVLDGEMTIAECYRQAVDAAIARSFAIPADHPIWRVFGSARGAGKTTALKDAQRMAAARAEPQKRRIELEYNTIDSRMALECEPGDVLSFGGGKMVIQRIVDSKVTLRTARNEDVALRIGDEVARDGDRYRLTAIGSFAPHPTAEDAPSPAQQNGLCYCGKEPLSTPDFIQRKRGVRHSKENCRPM